MTEPLPSFADHYRTGSFAPYLRGTRLAGVAGEMVEAAQRAGDLSDPPVACLVLTVLQSKGVRATCDVGGGRFRDHSLKGSLFLIPPRVATTFLIDDDHVIRALGVNSEWIRPHLARARPDSDPFDFRRLHAGAFQNGRVVGLLELLWAETQTDDPASCLHAEALVLSIVAELLREAERPLAVARGGLAPWQVRRVTDYLDANLARDVALDELAALVGLSEFHFCTAFRRSTGLPPHRWLTARRMEVAKAMITEQRDGLTEIALAVGYGSQSAFGAAFRRTTGLTPTAWLRATKN